MLAPATPDFEVQKFIESQTLTDINLCWTCSSCDMECPVNRATNRLRPQKIVRLASLGFMDELLMLPEIWYCLKCRRCNDVCPNRVKPAWVFDYIKKETFRRSLVSLEMIQRRRILITHFQRVRWRAAEQCLSGRIESITDHQWYDWLKTPIDVRRKKISLAGFNSSESLRNVISNSSLYCCFNCRECSNACPVVSERNVFDPLWIFHKVHIGLEEEILKSPSIWLCMACKRCTEACSQLVNGQFIIEHLQKMAVRKGFVDKGFLFRWYKAQKVIYPLLIKEIDALLMDSVSDNFGVRKNIELRLNRKTIIASVFMGSNRIKASNKPVKKEQTTNRLKVSASH